MPPIRSLVALALPALLLGCGATIRPGQRGLKYIALSHPALEHEVRAEGFYWQWPWNSIVTYDVTWQSQTESIDILTADDLHVKTSATVTYRPRMEELYRLQTEIGPAYYQRIIGPNFVTLTRSEFARHAHNDLAKDGPQIESQVLKQLREAIAGKPLEIDRISIKHIEYDQGVTNSISAKLATAQRMEQKEFELKIAERDADITRTTAKGRSDARRIEAEGEAAATVLQGRAQAQAQSEITRTLTPSYLRYKAFDNDATRYYFVPTGKDGLPIILSTDAGPDSAHHTKRGAKPLGRNPTTR
jgi:regulator of protease activity HflC (stomatin/prohibitin superfamily)